MEPDGNVSINIFMEAIYIGPAQRLFGVYYEPGTEIKEGTAIVLIHPFANEYVRCYRMVHVLATELASSGYHVLRFDLSGFGDSDNNLKDVNIGTWMDDIYLAITELKEGCGINDIILGGIRFGASLAYSFASKHQVAGLFLLSPIISGDEYIKSLDQEYKEWLSGSFAVEERDTNGSYENFGYVIGESLLAGMKDIDLCSSVLEKPKSILIIDSSKTGEELLTKLKKDGISYRFQEMINVEFWVKKEDEIAKSIIPIQEIQYTKDWLKESFN